MNRRGSALVLMMLLTVAALITARLCADMMLAWVGTQRAQTAADFALLSAVRVRGQSLETVAARWDDFGAPITHSGGTLNAPASLVTAIAANALALKRALPGYQGRITSALTVAAEANGVARTAVTQSTPGGLRLGLEAQTQFLSSTGFPTLSIEGLWLRRVWLDTAEAGTAAVSVAWNSPRLGGSWTFTAPASARLEWDADTHDVAVAADGNGGFSGDWVSASSGALFRPDRYPVYRAQLAALP